LLGNRSPDTKRRIALAPREGDDTNLSEVLGRIEVAHHLLAKCWVFGQQAQDDHVVGFTTAHGLCEDKYALRGFSPEPPEPFPQETLHPISKVILLKELDRLDAVFDQICEVQYDITPVTVKHTLPRFAELL
jgi:hypothetical protein